MRRDHAMMRRQRPQPPPRRRQRRRLQRAPLPAPGIARHASRLPSLPLHCLSVSRAARPSAAPGMRASERRQMRPLADWRVRATLPILGAKLAQQRCWRCCMESRGSRFRLGLQAASLTVLQTMSAGRNGASARTAGRKRDVLERSGVAKLPSTRRRNCAAMCRAASTCRADTHALTQRAAYPHRSVHQEAVRHHVVQWVGHRLCLQRLRMVSPSSSRTGHLVTWAVDSRTFRWTAGGRSGPDMPELVVHFWGGAEHAKLP
mmetsp:Transcript_69263/g.130596  ORF Transcript_69263/g.130596 Transcript_69263/m.130596 type:complete len:261 (+) Transcript_69263:218-1000(+)